MKILGTNSQNGAAVILLTSEELNALLELRHTLTLQPELDYARLGDLSFSANDDAGIDGWNTTFKFMRAAARGHHITQTVTTTITLPNKDSESSNVKATANLAV